MVYGLGSGIFTTTSSTDAGLCDYSCFDFYFDCFQSENVQLPCSTTSPTTAPPKLGAMAW